MSSLRGHGWCILFVQSHSHVGKVIVGEKACLLFISDHRLFICTSQTRTQWTTRTTIAHQILLLPSSLSFDIDTANPKPDQSFPYKGTHLFSFSRSSPEQFEAEVTDRTVEMILHFKAHVHLVVTFLLIWHCRTYRHHQARFDESVARRRDDTFVALLLGMKWDSW